MEKSGKQSNKQTEAFVCKMIDQACRQMHSLQNQYSETQKKLNQITQNIRKKQIQASKLQKQCLKLSNKEEQINRIRDEMQKLEQISQALEEKMADMQQQINNKNQKLQQIKVEYQSLKKAQKDIEYQLQEARKFFANKVFLQKDDQLVGGSRDKIYKLNEEYASREIDQMQRQLKKKTEELKKLEIISEDNRKDLQNLQKTMRTIKSEIDQCKNAHQSKKIEIKRQELTKIKRTQNPNFKLSNINRQLQKQLMEAQSMNKNIIDLKESLIKFENLRDLLNKKLKVIKNDPKNDPIIIIQRDQQLEQIQDKLQEFITQIYVTKQKLNKGSINEGLKSQSPTTVHEQLRNQSSKYAKKKYP